MLTRRHIRVKVLQSLYAMYHTDHPDLDKQEKFLLFSMGQMQDLYAVLLQLLIAIRDHAEKYQTRVQNKMLASESEKNPSRNFIDNRLLQQLKADADLQTFIKNKKLNLWELDDEYVILLFNQLKELDWYQEYLSLPATEFDTDRNLVVKLYKEVMAPNDKLYDYLEDKQLTWIDDYPIVNTALVKRLQKWPDGKGRTDVALSVYKNDEDREFAVTLLRKVFLNDEKLTAAIDAKTPNWDQDRIADLDMIILKMGIAEFDYFPSIPVKVTINEYLEIAKEYSTPKSSLFVNGILDKIVKEYQASGNLNKIGRGLR